MFASPLNSIKYLDPVQHVKPAENLRSGILSGILDNAKKIPLIGQMLGSNENTSIESNLAQNEQNESDITKQNGENTTFESMIGILTNIDKNIQILVSNENKDENLENSIPEEPKKDENSDKKGIFQELKDSFYKALGLNIPTEEKSKTKTTGLDEEILAEINANREPGSAPYTLDEITAARNTNTNAIQTTGSDEEILAELNRGYPDGSGPYNLEQVRQARNIGSQKIVDNPPVKEALSRPEIELKTETEAEKTAPRQRTALDIEVDRERQVRAAPRQRTALDIEVDRERQVRAAPRQRTALDEEIQVTREWWNYGFDTPPSKEQVDTYLRSGTPKTIAKPRTTSSQNQTTPKVDVSTLKPGTPEYDAAVMKGQVPLPKDWKPNKQEKLISSKETEKDIDNRNISEQENISLKIASQPEPRPIKNPYQPMKASSTNGYDSNMIPYLDDLDTEFFKIVYTNYARNATFLEKTDRT